MQTFDVCSHSCSRSLCHHRTPYQQPPGSAASHGNGMCRDGFLGGYTCTTARPKHHIGWTMYAWDSKSTTSIWPTHGRSRRRVDPVTRPTLCRRVINLCAVISVAVVADASHAVFGMRFRTGLLFVRSMPLQTQLLFRRYAGTTTVKLFWGSVKITHAAIADVGKTAPCGMRRCRWGTASIFSYTVRASMGTHASFGMGPSRMRSLMPLQRRSHAIADVGKTATCGMRRQKQLMYVTCRRGIAGVLSKAVSASLGTDASTSM